MIIYHEGDVHLDIITAKEYYYETHLPKLERLKQLDALDLIVIGGDFLDSPIKKDSEVYKIGLLIILDYKKLCLQFNAVFRIITGTWSHDGDSMSLFLPETKFGKLYEFDSSALETRIIERLKDPRECVLKYDKQEIVEEVDGLLSLYHDILESTEDEIDFMIYKKPVLERINGYEILFVPEMYVSDDSEVSRLFKDNIDICFFHGMVDTAMPMIKGLTTNKVYNRAIIFKESWFNNINLFSVGAHVHRRMTLIPKGEHHELGDVVHDFKLMYGGSPNQHTFADAGLKVGSHIIRVTDDTWSAELILTRDYKRFHVFEITKLLKDKKVSELIAIFTRINRESKGSIRVDTDISALDKNMQNKYNEFKMNFPNFKYKDTGKYSEVEHQNKLTENKRLLKLPIKELAIQLSSLTAEDYDEVFVDFRPISVDEGEENNE